MLKLFHFDIYDLLDPGDILSFLIPYITMRFDILPNMLLDMYYVSTPINESIVAKRVYRNCIFSLFYRVIHVCPCIDSHVRFQCYSFYVLVAFFYASIDYIPRVVKFQLG